MYKLFSKHPTRDTGVVVMGYIAVVLLGALILCSMASCRLPLGCQGTAKMVGYTDGHYHYATKVAPR